MDNRQLVDFLVPNHAVLMRRLQYRGIPPDDRDDCLQAACVVAMATTVPPNLDFGPGAANFAAANKRAVAWFATTAHRIYLDSLKHAGGTKCVLFDESIETSVPGTDNPIDQLISDAPTREAWSQLSDADKAVLQLRRNGNSCSEIATALGITLEAAKQRLQTARPHFKEKLLACGEDIASSGRRIMPRIRE